MFDDEIDAGKTIAICIIGIVVVGIAIGAVFKASDQVVQNSNGPQLQVSYQTGKEMINNAGNLKDGADLANSVENLGK